MANLSSKLAALALTVVMSATCILGAVGPATAGAASAVASSARLMA